MEALKILLDGRKEEEGEGRVREGNGQAERKEQEPKVLRLLMLIADFHT